MRKTNSFLIFKKAYDENAVFVMSVSCQQTLWVNICFVPRAVTYTHEMRASVAWRVCCVPVRDVRVSGTQCCGTNYSKRFLQVCRIFS